MSQNNHAQKLKGLLQSDNLQSVTQGLSLLDSLISNQEDCKTVLCSITEQNNVKEATVSLSKSPHGRTFILWFIEFVTSNGYQMKDVIEGFSGTYIYTFEFYGWEDIWGYTKTTEALYEYWSNTEYSLSDYIFYRDEFEGEIPKEAVIDFGFDWYDLIDASSVLISEGNLSITESIGGIWSFELDFEGEVLIRDITPQSNPTGGGFLYVGEGNEGLWYGEYTLEEIIDMKKLGIRIQENYRGGTLEELIYKHSDDAYDTIYHKFQRERST